MKEIERIEIEKMKIMMVMAGMRREGEREEICPPVLDRCGGFESLAGNGGEPQMNEIASGYIRVVLGSGEPGTQKWNAGTVVRVHESHLEYVRQRMGKKEVDREVMVEAARWEIEMDQILAEAEELELEEEMEDFLQLLPEEVC